MTRATTITDTESSRSCKAAMAPTKPPFDSISCRSPLPERGRHVGHHQVIGGEAHGGARTRLQQPCYGLLCSRRVFGDRHLLIGGERVSLSLVYPDVLCLRGYEVRHQLRGVRVCGEQAHEVAGDDEGIGLAGR